MTRIRKAIGSFIKSFKSPICPISPLSDLFKDPPLIQFKESWNIINGTAVQLQDGALIDAKKNIDIVAMTTHGRSGVKGFLLGSVAEKVLRHSPKPVFLVRCT